MDSKATSAAPIRGGAGLYFDGTESVELVNSTVGSTGGTSAIYGGAYDHRPVKVRLLDCTVNGNEAYGVFLRGFAGSVYVAAAEYFGTIVSGHAQSFAVTQESNGFATFTSLGYNISSDATGNLTGPGDHPSTDPLLGVLAYNGGQTPQPEAGEPGARSDPAPVSARGHRPARLRTFPGHG